MSLKAVATSATSPSPSTWTLVDKSPSPTRRAAVTSRPRGAVSRPASSQAARAAATGARDGLPSLGHRTGGTADGPLGRDDGPGQPATGAGGDLPLGQGGGEVGVGGRGERAAPVGGLAGWQPSWGGGGVQ